jgi:hypothetical protein
LAGSLATAYAGRTSPEELTPLHSLKVPLRGIIVPDILLIDTLADPAETLGGVRPGDYPKG